MGNYKTDRWVNGQGVLNGREAFVRKNVSLQATRKADYPTVLLVSLIDHELTENGLPGSSDELDRLDATEEAIADHMCARYGALFALCVTAQGTRGLFLFLPGRPTEQELEAGFQSCAPSVDFDFSLRHDAGWRPYMTLLPEPDDVAPGGVITLQLPWWKRLLGLS